MLQFDLEEVLERAYEDVSRVIPFGEELWTESKGVIRPKMHQIVRIHEAVKQGTKRMVLEDTTSSGKTLNAVAIKGLMDRESPEGRVRSLLIAPNQAIESAWTESEINNYMHELGLRSQRTIRIEDGSVSELLDHDFVYVNYEKLSRLDSDSYTNEHMAKLNQILPEMDLVTVDESHNLKNINANRTRNFRNVVEKTRDKNFLILSASAIPNRMSDVGFLLYLFDPKKHGHYSRNAFDYNTDKYSVMNARNSPGWFTFGRDDLKNLLDLPDLHFGDSDLGIDPLHRFEMGKEYVERYFEEWSPQNIGGSKVSNLSRILLESEIDEIVDMCGRINDKDPNSQVGIFSFYTAGFSEEMARRLNEKFGRAAVITGNNPSGSSTKEKVQKRVELAKRFNSGDLKYLVNTTSTVSESISLITRDRPGYLIFAEPPIVPAVHDQTIGRFYRILQEAPIHVIEMIPKSDRLNQMMRDYKDSIDDRIKFRKSWVPGTTFEDHPKIREEKNDRIRRVTSGMSLGHMSELVDVEEGTQNVGAYTSILKKDENGDKGKKDSRNKVFNDGLKSVRYHIGRSAEDFAQSNDREALIEVYDNDDLWDHSSSADTNEILAQMIRTIRTSSGESLDKILDWGSASNCLGRTLKEPVYNLDLMSEWKKKGKNRALELGLEGQVFVHGNAKDMPFDDGFFDLVSSSYAIQYNAQGFEHKRDVEEILIETNRVLRERGYGIFALPNQAATTTIADSIDGLETLLREYGFNVLFSEFITGHAENPETGRENKVFNGVPIILYQKKEDRDKLIDKGFEDIFIYSPYKLSGIGGERSVLAGCAGNTNTLYKKKDIRSDKFKIGGKDNFQEAVARSLY